jgi:hypothetical protein
MENWAIFLATLVSPIAAVLITRWLDDRRESRQRKYNCFENLMASRRKQLSGQFVDSLNLALIIYMDSENVIRELYSLFDHFNNTAPIAKEDQEGWKQWHDEKETRITKLIFEMCKELNVSSKIEQLDIMKKHYAPQYWADTETDQVAIRKFVVDLREGKVKFPVSVSLEQPSC